MEITSKKTGKTPLRGIRENQQANVSDWDVTILKDIREFQPDCKQSVDRLGIVLEEMVNMLDLDGSGIDVFLIQYVVGARQCLRAILQLLEDPGPNEISSDNQM